MSFSSGEYRHETVLCVKREMARWELLLHHQLIFVLTLECSTNLCIILNHNIIILCFLMNSFILSDLKAKYLR